MSAHTKTPLTKLQRSYLVIYKTAGEKPVEYKIPDSLSEEFEIWLKERAHFPRTTNTRKDEECRSPWEECIPWESIAAKRIAKYTKAGIVLRGARHRENLSQKKLASLCGISQDNLSKMENGKRTIGASIAKRLAEALNIDAKLLLT